MPSFEPVEEKEWAGEMTRESFKEFKGLIATLKYHSQFNTKISTIDKITRTGACLKLIKTSMCELFLLQK